MRTLTFLCVAALCACGPKDGPVVDTEDTTPGSASTAQVSTDTGVATMSPTSTTSTTGSSTEDPTLTGCAVETIGCTSIDPTTLDPSITGCIVQTVGCTSIDPSSGSDTSATATDTDTDTGTGTDTEFDPCAVETIGCPVFTTG